MNKKFIVAGSLILLFLLISAGCSPAAEFGELAVCRKIDSQTYRPLAVEDEFEVDDVQIFATIEVSNVDSSHFWSFRWTNEQSGQVLASNSGQYMENSNYYVSGYFASSLKASPEEGIIAVPGTYRVEFFHNRELVDSKSFNITQPQLKILQVCLASQISEEGKPAGTSEEFHNCQDIYLYLDINYSIDGTKLGVEWFREDQSLALSELVLEGNDWHRTHRVFKLESGKGLVLGSYRADIYVDGRLDRSIAFEVENNLEANQVYRNDDYGLSLQLPQWLEPEETETENFHQINFVPRDSVQDLRLGVWIMDKDKAPAEKEWDEFSQRLATENIAEEYGIEFASSQPADTGYVYTYNSSDGNYWELRLNFEQGGDYFYIFSGVAEEYYVEDMNHIYTEMLDSIDFSLSN
ncbi:MAG: hypothetical protein K9H14_06410 [Actinomycetia bacterium]|nr:hypothetical protein [Actinomycetes bacterium]